MVAAMAAIVTIGLKGVPIPVVDWEVLVERIYEKTAFGESLDMLNDKAGTI